MEWDGEHAGTKVFEAPRWPHDAPWTLEIGARASGLEGMYAHFRFDQIALGGLVPDGTAAPLVPADAAAERAALISRLRADPSGTSALLVRELGLGATLDLVDAAFGTTAVAPLGRDDLLSDPGLALLDTPEAARRYPLLVGWRGLMLLRAGHVSAAADLLDRAAMSAGDSGDACTVARAGLAILAGTRQLAEEADDAWQAAACAPHPAVADARFRRLGIEAP